MCANRATVDAIADLSNSGELFHIVLEVEKETGYTFNKPEMKYYTLENANMILITF